ncbi:MAG: hypothetical protein A2147_06505 [Chloroflexi bacterium RBG_16_57_8]|nr:MAG: hypothetical protein A2147_06505 [Chloroflexi bacterium RBG_16_57_8]
MGELPVPIEKMASRLEKTAEMVERCAAMVEGQRECSEVLAKMAAARSALLEAETLLLTRFAHQCVEEVRKTGATSWEALTRAFSAWAAGTENSLPRRTRHKGA